tara:strand:- start:560 stop:742 length:183 start_codon:yes stop_codon:yes gene_type:complete
MQRFLSEFVNDLFRCAILYMLVWAHFWLGLARLSKNADRIDYFESKIVALGYLYHNGIPR